MKKTGYVPCTLLLAFAYIMCACMCVHAHALISSIVMVVFVIATHCLIGTELLDVV